MRSLPWGHSSSNDFFSKKQYEWKTAFLALFSHLKLTSLTSTSKSLRMKRLFSTWKTSIQFLASITTTVLGVNINIVVWASVAFPAKHGNSLLMKGNCSKISTVDTVMHFVINVLSILLLTASNFVMQCLSSPTREEINKAYSKGHWLDIGVPTMKNLTCIDLWRSFLWILLAFSSIPLAFL